MDCTDYYNNRNAIAIKSALDIYISRNYLYLTNDAICYFFVFEVWLIY